MKDVDQNIAIAEFLQWTVLIRGITGETEDRWLKQGDDEWIDHVIDYGRCLTSITYEARSLKEHPNKSLWSTYNKMLIQIVSRDVKNNSKNDELMYDVINASAKQRREALVKTIGKWKE